MTRPKYATIIHFKIQAIKLGLFCTLLYANRQTMTIVATDLYNYNTPKNIQREIFPFPSLLD